MSASQAGSAEAATNTPEMKLSGKTMARTTGCAASTLPMRLATARPMPQKTTAPTTTSAMNAGAVRPGIVAP
jgi:hypothetical protein